MISFHSHTMFNVTTLNDIVEFTNQPNLAFIAPLLCLTLILLLSNIFKRNQSRKVFLVDFACYKPPSTQMCTKEMAVENMRLSGLSSGSTLEFVQKLLERSGLGQSTYLPEALLSVPFTPCMEKARREAEMVMFGAVDELLSKTGVKSKDIGIVIVNCCLFNVVPSLSAMIVNRYKLGENVVSYNLSGMGCTAGLIAIGLAKQLLQVRHNSHALVVSTENITQNCYFGDKRSMLLSNALFRVGGAAILLSNRPSDQVIAKYQLIHTVNTHTANSDPSYNCIVQEEDPQGHRGVTITKDLMAVANKAIEANLTTLGPLVLPISEHFLYITNYMMRYFHVAKIKPYVPNFKKAIDHVICHVGGKPVLDEVEKNLKLSESDMEASRMTLYRFGNTSSSSVWYGLAYAEAKGRIERGNRVWQIAFGSGFKCSSVIWRAMRTVDGEEKNPWSDEIDEFPVDLKFIELYANNFEPFKDK